MNRLVNDTQRLEIFKRLKARNPKPTTELRYENTFQLLVAVILSAQATDISVNKATAPLFQHIKTPTQLLRLGEAQFKRAIQTIGLYNSKAKHVLATCQRLVDDFDGQVPNTRDALESLPGVGRKTANVILNTAFGKPTIAVDTHIFRVANRIGLAGGKTPRQVEDQLTATLPPEFIHDAHHWLILLGRYICVARKPKCPQCPIQDLCHYPQKTPPELFIHGDT